MKKITVLIVEDHRVVREGLRLLLDQKDIVVLAEAEDGREAVNLAHKLHPDVVIMDISMPMLNGLEAARQILRFKPSPKMLILSAHNDDAYIDQARALGASGYLSKRTTGFGLAEAVRKVCAGGAFFSPQASALPRSNPGGKKTAVHLTSRETEVLQLVAEGKSNKETASELQISVKTVEKHRQSLMGKLNIHHAVGLTRHALSIGLIEGRVPLTVV
jgi:DNA-binding NarL/FixJ family response regulator